MKRQIQWALGAFALTLFITLSGCTSKTAAGLKGPVSETQAKNTANAAGAAKASGDNTAAAKLSADAANQYARLGELLLMPEGFQYANQMFDQALALDPKNGKANFYKAWVGPLVQVKGFLTLVQPLVVRQLDVEALERLRDNIANLNMPELQDFSYVPANSQKPFNKYYDVQRFIREQMLPAIQASLVNLAAIDTTLPLQLNFTPERAEIDPRRKTGSYSYYDSSCMYDPNSGWSCQDFSDSYSYDTKKLPNVYLVDQYDIKILRSSLLAMQDQIRVGTAYSTDNVEVATRQIKAVDDIRRQSGLPGASAQDIVNILQLSQFSDLFTLEKDNQLAQVVGSTGEALRNAIDLANLKDKLCTGTTRTAKNSLFRPICIEAAVVDQLRTGVDALAGPTQVTLGYDQNGVGVQILMDIAPTLNNPPADIKRLLPSSFDDQGAPVNYPDPTMGGLFPNGDFIAKLEQISYPRHYDDGAVRALRRGVRKASHHL